MALQAQCGAPPLAPPLTQPPLEAMPPLGPAPHAPKAHEKDALPRHYLLLLDVAAGMSDKK